MNPAEIVVGKMQRQGRFQPRQLLAERIGQPGEPVHHHADGQVLAACSGGPSWRARH